MSNILEKAEKFYYVCFESGEKVAKTFFMDFVKTIISEIDQARQMVERIHDNGIKDYNDLRSRLDQLAETVGTKLREQDGQVDLNRINMETLNERLKALEKRVPDYTKWHDVDEFYPPDAPEPEPTVKEEVDTDKDGKPEGGLKRGDVISFPLTKRGKMLGQFLKMVDNEVYGSWQSGRDGYVSRDHCTFEFRPRFPDRKEG